MLDNMSPLFMTIDGRRMAYAEVGPSRPKGTILLLPGLGCQRFSWYKQLAVFGQEYRTIALDPRDTGESDPVTRPYRISDLADDAASLLEALSITKSHIVGISMGGMVALELTLRHSEVVDRLVLVSTTPRSLIYELLSPRTLPQVLTVIFIGNSNMEPGEQKRRALSLLMAPGFAESHPEEMERIAEIGRCERITKEAFSRQVRACMRHNVSKRLGQIKAPTLVIHGENDPGIAVNNGISLGRQITGARLIVYPNTGHALITERAEEFNRDVLDFLAQSSLG